MRPGDVGGSLFPAVVFEGDDGRYLVYGPLSICGVPRHRAGNNIVRRQHDVRHGFGPNVRGLYSAIPGYMDFSRGGFDYILEVRPAGDVLGTGYSVCQFDVSGSSVAFSCPQIWTADGGLASE